VFVDYLFSGGNPQSLLALLSSCHRSGSVLGLRGRGLLRAKVQERSKLPSGSDFISFHLKKSNI
jgi:hypothetical protein